MQAKSEIFVQNRLSISTKLQILLNMISAYICAITNPFSMAFAREVVIKIRDV